MSSPPSPCITLEEHAVFQSLSPELIEGGMPYYDDIWKLFPAEVRKLQDMGAGRLADMDEGGVSTQVLSLLPGLATRMPAAASRAANDEMAAVILKSGGDDNNGKRRFAGFAVLPMAEPSAAAVELERCVRDHPPGCFVGALVDNRLPDGVTHYDGAAYDVLWEVAQRLDVPIYLHPSPPLEATCRRPKNGDEEGSGGNDNDNSGGSADGTTGRFCGNFPEYPVGQGVATGAWGWHEDVGLGVVKMFAAGVFRRFPRLKIIVGHLGEMLPLMVDRLDRIRFFQGLAGGDDDEPESEGAEGDDGIKGKSGAGFAAVWRRNIYVTSSGMFSVRMIDAAARLIEPGHLLYAVDTPFEASATGRRFLEELARRGTLEAAGHQLDDFAHGSARRLLRLP